MSVLTESALQTRFRELIHREIGIRMPDTKENLIASRLRRRLLEGQFRDLQSYFLHLFEGGGLEEEWPHIVDLITTNKTDFFRENAHFEYLANRIVPEALGRARPGTPVRFRLWSAAASTGAEAYTAAMILAEARLNNPLLDWMILGTDISEGVLAHARKAIYPEKDVAPVPADLRSRYLMTGRGRASERQVRIVPELRRRVRFACLNLIEPPYPTSRALDVIFLRNVLIYFDDVQKERIIASIVGHLRPGGHLFVGHSESMVVVDARLDQIAPAAFRRKDQQP